MTLHRLAESGPAVAAIVGLLAITTALLRGLAWFRQWSQRDLIATAFEDGDSLEQVARHLDDIGEHGWAEEKRREARMRPLLRIARYDSNRANVPRDELVATAAIAWVVSLILLVDKGWAPAILVSNLSVLYAAGVGLWWLATQPRINREVRTSAQAKYEARYGSSGDDAPAGSRPTGGIARLRLGDRRTPPRRRARRQSSSPR